MRKLGKKNHEIIETVEAYNDMCYALEDCYSRCSYDSARKSLNDRLYNIAYNG